MNNKLIQHLMLNPQIAESLIDACNTITACDEAGKPLRRVSPADFSDKEWAALVDVANLISE